MPRMIRWQVWYVIGWVTLVTAHYDAEVKSDWELVDQGRHVCCLVRTLYTP